MLAERLALVKFERLRPSETVVHPRWLVEWWVFLGFFYEFSFFFI
jgi:hypothetical protein